MIYKRTTSILALLLALCVKTTANAQTDYEKRQQANKVNNEQLNNVYQNNLPNKPATSSMGTGTPAPSSSVNSIYVTDHQKKMEYYTNKENQRLAAWEEKERKFELLSADVPKTEENYQKLIALAEQAGFEPYDAMRMNGRYAPKVVRLPVLTPYQQQLFDNYKELSYDYRKAKSYNLYVNVVQQALNISDDLHLRSQLASVYRYDLLDYNAAANEYHLIHQSPQTEKTGMDGMYMDWGIVSIMGGNYEKALWCFNDLPSRYYDIWGGSIYQSYAFYLLGNSAKAQTMLLERYTNEIHTDYSNLIKSFYLLQQGSNDAAAALLQKVKEKNTTLNYSGDTRKDLALVLLNCVKNDFNSRNLEYCYFLDLAADLVPTNNDIIETRYDFNSNLKRVGHEAGMPPDVLATLAAGKIIRDTKRADDIEKAKQLEIANRGMLVLWFGQGNKPAYFMAYQKSLANDAEIQKTAEELTKKFPGRNNNPFLSYIFHKGYIEEDIYREAATKLKVKPRYIKDSKYGEIYMLDK